MSFKRALADTGMRAFMGEDASLQPGQVADMLLHESAASWVRQRLIESSTPKFWLETRSQYATRPPEVREYINDKYDVDVNFQIVWRT